MDQGMTTIGTTSKPSFGYHAYGGSSYPNQEAELLTMPSRGTIVTLGAWIGGWAATCRAKLALWDADGNLIGSSAQFTVANEGAAAEGHVSLYEVDLATPVDLSNGADFYVGFARHPDDAHQVSTGGNGTGPHYEDKSGGTWPNDFDAAGGDKSSVVRRIGCYVADFTEAPGAWIRRSGAWVEADAVQLRRSGAWADADTVQLRRSGAWTDSQ